MKEIRLMKGNEAFAEALIRAGTDAYFGYPITPQNEVLEYLTEVEPHKRTGMIVLQVESEISAINMCYGGAGAGFKVATSSSSPGISLMMEGISYMAGAELPALILNVSRGGPGLGTIQPSQSDYFQAVKGGGHGDYKLFVIAPASVQEMADFVPIAFDVAFKYRTPTMILSDGIIGQMMEKVVLFDQMPRKTLEQIEKDYPWATTGKKNYRQRNIITSLDLDPIRQEKHVLKLQEKYKKIEENELRYEEIETDDAEFILVAYGSSARICLKVVKLARKEGLKVGLLRLITLFPFPYKKLEELSKKVAFFLVTELSTGQMVEDVILAVKNNAPVYFYGRTGGAIYTPNEILDFLKSKL